MLQEKVNLCYDSNGMIFQFDNGIKASETVYSDRLYSWNPKKHDELCKKHFGNQGQSWSNREPGKIQDFLSDYEGKNVILCRIEYLDNISNGNPYWRFDYKFTDNKK
jgi:hypothetical protein